MSQYAKVFARVFDYGSTPDMPEGQMTFTVEWKRITGARLGGKVKLTAMVSSDARLRDDLRDALASYLSQKFAPEVFRPRDIVGYSV
jgi:hypothetical protein